MNINCFEVINFACSFADTILRQRLDKMNLSPKERDKILSNDILKTKVGKDYVDNVVLGAIIGYHDQLREVLLKSGIDIGDITVDN